MKCPVCDSELNSLSCPVCGFDASRDYERFPTFAPIREAVSAAGLRDRRAPKDALRCEKCGSTAFSIRIPDNTRRCQRCGWTPDHRPHIECSCGGRYFLVPADGSGLLCPLCGRVTDLPRKPQAPVIPPEIPVAPAKPAVPSLLDHYGKKSADTKAPVRKAPPAPAVKPVITAIAAGAAHTVALYSDGTVRAIGDGSKNQCHVQTWTGITAIAAGDNHLVGLLSDGTLLAVGENEEGQCDVDRLMPEQLR